MIGFSVLIEQLKSWSNSYIPPMAKITMDDAVAMLIQMNEEMIELRKSIDELEIKVKELESPKPAPTKAPPRKRVKKAI